VEYNLKFCRSVMFTRATLPLKYWFGLGPYWAGDSAPGPNVVPTFFELLPCDCSSRCGCDMDLCLDLLVLWVCMHGFAINER
jgi:hypothetical protein